MEPYNHVLKDAMDRHRKRQYPTRSFIIKKIIRETVEALYSSEGIIVTNNECDNFIDEVKKYLPAPNERGGRTCRNLNVQIVCVYYWIRDVKYGNKTIKCVADEVGIDIYKANPFICILKQAKLNMARERFKATGKFITKKPCTNKFIPKKISCIIPLIESKQVEFVPSIQKKIIDVNDNSIIRKRKSKKWQNKSRKFKIKRNKNKNIIHTKREIILIKRKNWLKNRRRNKKYLKVNLSRKKSKSGYFLKIPNTKYYTTKKMIQRLIHVKKNRIINQNRSNSINIALNYKNNIIQLLKSSGFTPPVLI